MLSLGRNIQGAKRPPVWGESFRGESSRGQIVQEAKRPGRGGRNVLGRNDEGAKRPELNQALPHGRGKPVTNCRKFFGSSTQQKNWRPKNCGPIFNDFAIQWQI